VHDFKCISNEKQIACYNIKKPVTFEIMTKKKKRNELNNVTDVVNIDDLGKHYSAICGQN